jgi:hypothetical protein
MSAGKDHFPLTGAALRNTHGGRSGRSRRMSTKYDFAGCLKRRLFVNGLAMVTLMTVVVLIRHVTDAADTNAPGAETRSIEQLSGSSGFESSRFAANFLGLAGRSWKQTGLTVGKVIAFGLVGGIASAVCGGVIGFAGWLVLRRRGVFSLDRSWYKYLKWLWCPAFVLPMVLGFGYAGAFWGTGHAVKRAVLQDRIVDRLVANLYVAAALDSADYQMKGEERLGEIQATLKKSEQLSGIVTTNLGRLIKRTCQARAAAGNLALWKARALSWVSDSALGDFALSRATGELDAWIVISVFYAVSMSSSEGEAFLKSNPEANVAVAAVTSYLDRIRLQLAKWVSSFALAHAFLGVVAGVAAPLVLTGAFILTRRKLLAKDPITVSQQMLS